MPTLLARADLKTQYVRDPFMIEAIDVGQIVSDLAAASPTCDPSLWVGRTPFTEYDHIVLANDRKTGRCLGLLAAQDAVTECEQEFLFLRAGFVAEEARARGLMRRLIALMLLRAAGNGATPTVIAARTSSQQFYKALHGFGARIPGAVVYPDFDSNAVSLRAAALARRIAQQVGRGVRYEMATSAFRGGLVEAIGGLIPPILSRDAKIDALFGGALAPQDQILVMVDLRAPAEELVIDQARRIYRRN
jgi:GNAT superfamily N-acetyltransferase